MFKLKYNAVEGRHCHRDDSLEVSYSPKDWWHFHFSMGVPNYSESGKFRFYLAILGFSIFKKINYCPKRDYMFGFGWNHHGYSAEFGPQTKKGGNWYCGNDSTGLKFLGDYPWRWDYLWSKDLAEDGSVAFWDKGENWYKTKLRRLFGTKRKDWNEKFDKREGAQKRIEKEFDFEYITRYGEIQKRKVFAYLSEAKYGWLFLPLITRKFYYFNYRFSEETGEKTGSWKGGVCSSRQMREKNETIEECFEKLKKEKF